MVSWKSLLLDGYAWLIISHGRGQGIFDSIMLKYESCEMKCLEWVMFKERGMVGKREMESNRGRIWGVFGPIPLTLILLCVFIYCFSFMQFV